MADQGRWFKLWSSAPSDDDLQALSPALRWAWAAFGVYTKVHGSRGVVSVSPNNHALATQMGIPISALVETIKVFPHMTVEEGKRANGSCVVTWHNWRKYQEDSTVAARVKALRAKRRGEEKRGEEKKPLPLSFPDEAFLKALKENPAYLGIDFERELARMDAWLLTPRGRGRKKTRQFIVNWLNKIDRPMGGGEEPGWHPGKHVS